MAEGVGLVPLLIGQIVIRRNCQIFRSALTNALSNSSVGAERCAAGIEGRHHSTAEYARLKPGGVPRRPAEWHGAGARRPSGLQGRRGDPGEVGARGWNSRPIRDRYRPNTR